MPGWIDQTEHHHSSLQDEGNSHGEVWIELSILLFHEHGCLKLVGMRCHGVFYTGVISKLRQQFVYKGSVGMYIPIIVMVVTIWDELFFKLLLYFDVLVSRKKFFS